MPKFRCNKLGRDKSIEGFKSQNITPQYHFLQGIELQRVLKDKLIEEVKEIQDAQTPSELNGELADLLEVVDGLCNAYEIDRADLMRIKEQKYARLGGFEKGFYLEAVEMEEDNPRTKHFRASPEKYFEE